VDAKWIKGMVKLPTFRPWAGHRTEVSDAVAARASEGAARARRVADQLGIHFHVIDAEAEFKAHVVDYILPGVVQLPHHWPDEANANNLSDDIHLDPISGFPAFKSQLCQVTKAK